MGADFIFSDLRIETVEVFEQQAGNAVDGIGFCFRKKCKGKINICSADILKGYKAVAGIL